ncbi:MAG: ComF family protein [Micavibrio sp.]|nr:ComF family protein [Micavibrio sp.]
MRALLAKTASKMIDTILPSRCIISGEIVDGQGLIASSQWGRLNFICTPHCDTCGFPFDFEVSEGALCAACLDYPPKYDSARSALVYDDVSRQFVIAFKHSDKTHYAPAFIPWLIRAGQELIDESDVIVPVPLHPLRLVRRRYNQAALLAMFLGKETGLGVANDAIRRTRATKTQGHLNMVERKKNVRKAFEVNPRRNDAIKGKRVLLLDDVYTTGATVNECTRALKIAGAKEVHVLTLARAVKDGFG